MVEQVRGSLNSPIGQISGVAAIVARVRGALQSPIGGISGVAAISAARVRGALQSPIGGISGRATTSRPGVKGALRSPLGGIRGMVFLAGDDWANAGFPLPQRDGYTYQDDPGLMRTPMYSGDIRQRKAWSLGRNRLSAKVTILSSRIIDIGEFFENVGSGTFNMRLVSGNAGAGDIAFLHVVRLIGDPVYGSIYGLHIDVTMNLEVFRQLQS